MKKLILAVIIAGGCLQMANTMRASQDIKVSKDNKESANNNNINKESAQAMLNSDAQITKQLLDWIQANISQEQLEPFVNWIVKYSFYLQEKSIVEMLQRIHHEKAQEAESIAVTLRKDAIAYLPKSKELYAIFHDQFRHQLFGLTEDSSVQNNLIKAAYMIDKISKYLIKTNIEPAKQKREAADAAALSILKDAFSAKPQKNFPPGGPNPD